ncbi:efflux RND transporter periplasmic adaptor subunit [Pseudoblastomonas halimionae]|uniref:Efflux RND transporter periplasmic adaptor subunit n=1 Tax=Alteriqipengyuania halimionae TaxID=1926630 RepID=A0A6I4U2U8_9SPHN|nr:efflux RND transporter periplasmic adaptor subunit [Alteriqipengyuania halimionae]MXP10350.1 efflux RND transporter periplasmic adaptor subunit [Alteriqipengyuania halimionae]
MASKIHTLFLLGAALLAGCSSGEEERTEEAIPVVAEVVRFLPEQTEVEAIGTARAVTSAEIYPESAGRVTRVMFSAGDYVRSGQPLLELEARQERLAVDAARVQVREAEQLLGRYRRIEDTGAISESQIEAGETALASARVALRQAQAAVDDRTVRAPFSGHIGLSEIDPGDRVGDSTPIAQLDQRSRLYIDFPAPEEVFAALRKGQVVQVAAFSDADNPIDARIISTDSSISSESRNFIARAMIENSKDRFRPGMSFRVAFTRNDVSRPSVAEEAIVWGGEGAHLFVVRDGKAVRVPVTITSRREGLALVDGRLTPRDRVIVEGVQKVRDGQSIRLVQRNGPPKADVELRPAENGTAANGG